MINALPWSRASGDEKRNDVEHYRGGTEKCGTYLSGKKTKDKEVLKKTRVSSLDAYSRTMEPIMRNNFFAASSTQVHFI